MVEEALLYATVALSFSPDSTTVMNFLMCVRIADLRATLRERRPIACRARLRAWAEFAKKLSQVWQGRRLF